MSGKRFEKAAVVLGMHRSGTSAIAGVLALAGFSAPKTLLPTSAANERGFWESAPIKALNDDLFTELGTSWHGLDAISYGAISKQKVRSASSRARAILEAEFEPGSRPLIKDPRLCRLLPFWQSAIAGLADSTVYVITVRSPLEVAPSLAKRNDFDADLSYLLWARYYLDVEFHTRGLPRAWITYDALIADWRDCLQVLESQFGKFQTSPTAELKIEDFLSAQLRHHRTADEQAFIELERLPIVQQTYRILLKSTRSGDVSGPALSSLDALREKFDDLGDTVSRVFENARLDRKRLANARVQGEAVSAELAQARKGLADLDVLRSALETQSAAQQRLEARIDSAVGSLAEAIEQRSVLERRLADAVSSAAQEQVATREKRESIEKKLAATASERDLLRYKIEKLRTDAERNAEERASLEMLFANSRSELEVLQKNLTATTSERDNVAVELENLRTHAREEREDLEKKLTAMASERDDAGVKLDNLRTRAREERESLEKRLNATASERDAVSIKIDALRVDAERNAKELQDAIGELQSNHELAQTELKDVKRKYRSTQFQLGRDREKLRRTQEQLASVEGDLATLRKSRVWRFQTALQGSVRRSVGTVHRLLGGKDRKRQAELATLVRGSPLFDRDWYLTRYSDVAAADVDPVVHYLENGWREGRDPSPRFSTASYLRANGDVARAGLNPLLHYLEFGYSEGRHINELSRPPLPTVLATEQELAPSAACASFSVAARSTTRWRRAARLGGAGDDVVEIAGQPIGLAGDGDRRSTIALAFRELTSLSGYSPAFADAGRARSADPAQLMIDIWHVSDGRLRSRWRSESGPVVIRAYQHDPAREGALSLVGEGLVSSEIDFVDINLANGFFPALFVVSDPGGVVKATKLLAFPSLCRGGLHYPELVALQPDTAEGPYDVMAIGEHLAERLSWALHGASGPFIAKVLIDLAGADGSESLFQDNFRAWLTKVMRIEMDPLDTQSERPGDTYLRNAVRLEVRFRKAGRTVIVAADTIPSISILTMPAAASDENDGRLTLPLLIASHDPAQPSTLFSVPPTNGLSVIAGTNCHPIPWPQLRPGEIEPLERLQVAAIRHLRRPPPNDSELLVPIAAGALDVADNDQPITWLVFPEDWDEEALRQSLEALTLQKANKPPMLGLVGDVQPAVASLAEELFGNRALSWPDVTAALDGVDTPLIGYLGAHVLLHDPRTFQVLSALLQDTGVVSAACVLIATEKRGKGWQVSVADPGSFAGTNASDEPHPRYREEAQLVWRATCPVLRPPRDLWIARSNIARGWLQRAGPMRTDEGLQVCTSLVTASYIADRLPAPAHLRPPASAELQAIRSKVLVG